MPKISSPCIQVCFVNPDTDLCMGCNRSVQEIENWLSYSEEKRLEIIAQLPARENKFAQ